MSGIGFIGAGNMAEALIKGILRAKAAESNEIIISDVRRERLDKLCGKYKVRSTANNRQVAQQAELLILSVKPQNFADVLNDIRGSIEAETLIISIAAGIRVGVITNVLGDVAAVRVMPNTPALIGEGVSGLFANKKGVSQLNKVRKLFDSVGKTVIVEDEKLMDVITAVSGSGPAYFFLMMEEMIKAAIELGLTEQQATDLVLQTSKGAATLAIERNGQESPAELRKKITSPGGTTEAALKILSEKGFGDSVRSAVKGAFERSRNLGL